MSWTDRLRDELPREERAPFLNDLQALVASLREGRTPVITSRLLAHADLALAYLDEGPKKQRARAAFADRSV